MADPTYRYLDLRPGVGAWPGATAHAVVYDSDDSVRLTHVATESPTIGTTGSAGLAGAASIAASRDGVVYVADLPGARIIQVLCDGSIKPLGCLGPETLAGPRGIVVGPRDRLYIADVSKPDESTVDDRGNSRPRSGRVVVVDRSTGTIVDIWEGWGTPVDLAVDSADRLYVVEAARGRILRVDADGRVDPEFDRAIIGPRAIASTLTDEGERLIVVCDDGRVVMLELDGRVDTRSTWTIPGGASSAAVAAANGVVYVATPSGVLAFSATGEFLGSASAGDVAAITLDCHGRLLAASGRGVRALDSMARARIGHLVLGPLPLVDGIDRWDRVVIERAETTSRSGSTNTGRTRLWTRTSRTTAIPGPPPSAPPPGEVRQRTGLDTWRPCPIDAPDALVLHEPAPYLWVCVELTGDGSSTAAVRSIRVDHLGTGLPGKLPALYAATDVDETTHRLVQLLAAPLDEVAEAIDELPRHFDAASVPAGELDELARWLAQPLDGRRPEAARRQQVAEAFVRHGVRGTRADLELKLSEVVGTTVRIDEPASHASLWMLGENSLGASSMLIPAEAQGAVVGTTAEVGWSHLIADNDVGWPLNSDVAHRFNVVVQTASLDEHLERELLDAIDREKPAHTLATLCVHEPRVGVGTACVGPATLIGGTCPSEHIRSDSATVVGGTVGIIQRGDING